MRCEILTNGGDRQSTTTERKPAPELAATTPSASGFNFHQYYDASQYPFPALFYTFSVTEKSRFEQREDSCRVLWSQLFNIISRVPPVFVVPSWRLKNSW